MAVLFTKAANGEPTCSVDGIRLHSFYNPTHEAVQFAQSLSCTFTPKYLLVTGPALSYCAIALRRLYPHATLCAVQYSSSFKAADSLWDKVFVIGQQDTSLCEQLYSFMGDEGIVSCLFASWHPSETAFGEAYAACWRQIKDAVIKSRNVLATRSYFAKRWIKNALRFCLFVHTTATVHKGTAPVIVCASGPSLRSSLPFIKKYAASCSLFCVSSALAPLTAAGIKPDLCISTDGGYWAKRHLSHALLQNEKMPLAFSGEASIPLSLLETHPVVPLAYGDGPGEALLTHYAYDTTPALRNGTVSGTAVSLALSLTDAPVFVCGLDLSPSCGFSHTQPNELECDDSRFDNRLHPKETRITPSTFSSPSLDIYRSWFSSNDFKGRVKRVSNHFRYAHTLGSISDVDWSAVEPYANEQIALTKCTCTSKTVPFSVDTRRNELLAIIANSLSLPEWQKAAVPAESIIMERSKGLKTETAATAAVSKAMRSFYKEIERSLTSGDSV